MIYVPILDNSYSCYSFIDNNIIRAYKTTNLEQNNDYTDIFINSHYLTNDGSIVLTEQPNCISFDKLTNDWKERNDLADILIITFFGALFFFVLPLIIYRRLFKRGGI